MGQTAIEKKNRDSWSTQVMMFIATQANHVLFLGGKKSLKIMIQK